MMSSCKECGSKLKQLFSSMYCPNEGQHGVIRYSLQLRSGPPPATCESDDIGTELASFLFREWKTEIDIKGTVHTGGIAGHFRVYDQDKCFCQGTVGAFGYIHGELMLSFVDLVASESISLHLEFTPK